MIKKTYIPGKPRNPKLGTATGTSGVGKTEFNQVAGSSHEHYNKGVLDQITEAMLVAALRDLITSTDTESELTDENMLSSLRVLGEITKNNETFLEDLKTRFLSKIEPDTAQGFIEFLKGISVEELATLTQGLEVGTFTTGALGSGAAVKMIDGTSYAEVDNLTVRQKATFRELIIESLKHIGGQLVLTPARMKCVRVVDGGTFYKCYFDTGDGEVSNEFVAGDFARCQVFTGSGTKFYWRLVTLVGEDWINISKTNAAVGSDAPEAGDDITQLGNATDTTRQNAQILSTVGVDAPSWKQYKGINSFSLEGKDTTVFSGNGNKISGETVFTSGGANLDDHLDGIAQDILDALQAAQDADDKAQQAIEDAEADVASLNEEIGRLQDQIDGKVSNWYYAYSPTLSNYPASDWTTNEIKDAHIGDTFTNTEPAPAENAGKSWRFIKDGSTYSWIVISDSDALKALLEASKAQATADGKSTTYLFQPTKYKLGDMWVLNADQTVNGTAYKQGELLTATQDSETFVPSHWLKRVRYTDDTAIDNLEIGGRNLIILQNVVDKNGRLTTVSNSTIYIYSDAGYYTTDKIYVNEGDEVVLTSHRVISGYLALGYFDEDDIFFSRPIMVTNFEANSYVLTIPNGVAYIRVSFLGSDSNYIKLEKGTIPTDWTPAPEDVQAEIDGLGGYMEGAFQDSVIDKAEAKAIGEHLKTINDRYVADNAVYNNLIANPFLMAGAVRTTLQNVMQNIYRRDKPLLDTAINNIVNNKTVTTPLRTAFNTAFTNYRLAITSFQTAVENARKAIEEQRVDNIEIGGRNLLLNSWGETRADGSVSRYTLSSKIENGENFVVRIKVKENTSIVWGNPDFYTQVIDGVNNQIRIGLLTEVSKGLWELKGTWDNKTGDTIEEVTFFMRGGSRPDFEVEWAKLEKGNKATDWSPAPEDVDAAIDGIEIGGRNLILNSLNRIGFTANNNSVYPIQDELVSGENYRRFRRTYPEGITSTEINTYRTEFFTPEKSGYYTYSTYFRPNEFDIELRLRFGSDTYGNSTLCKANEWTQISATAWIEAGAATRLHGVYGEMPPETVQWIDYNRVSVTSGNKAMDWTEAPEDTQAKIAAAVIKATYWSIKASTPVIYKDANSAIASGVHTPVTVTGELRSGTTTTQGGFISIQPNGGAESTATASPRSIAPTNAEGKTSYTVRLYEKADKVTLLDTMTIPVVFKGASGVNAINASLSNEADVLPASPEGVVSDYTGSGTIIRVFEGATELTYGTGNGQYQVTASGSGITVGSASTVGNTRVYGVASNMTSDNATITFTITGKTASGTSFSLTKVQAFAKSRTGQKGADGVSISLVDVEFAKNTAPATAPTTGWITTAPAITGTEQLWTRTKTSYSTGNPTYSTPANITPKKGDTGAVGQGVESVTEEYHISSSKTTQPAEGSAGWSTTQPTWSQGQYIWSRVKVVYKNPASTVYTGYAVSSEWEAVNDLQIGGRNLFSVNKYVSLRNSEGSTGGNMYSVGSSGALVVDGVDAATGYDTMKMVDLKANTEYIFTFNIPINDRFSFYDTDGVAINVARNWSSGNTQLTFKMGNVDGYIGGKFYPIEQSYPAEIYLMAEKGNKATDWTPAPEDTANELLESQGFMRARYIRDYLNGSSVNANNLWVQITALNKAGTNIALNKTVTSNIATVNLARITNGNMDVENYAYTSGGNQYVQIDLGAIHYDIDNINVYHYWGDSRTYNGTKTQISEDGITWKTIFDSAVSGTYKETAGGKSHTTKLTDLVENVQARIDAEKTRINDMLSDNVADPSEKQYLSNLWQEIYAEYPRIWAQANDYSVSKTTYEQKYTALKNILDPVLADLTINSTVSGSSIRTAFSQYYDARTVLQNAITNKVNTSAGDALAKANTAAAITDLFSGFNGGLATAVIMEMREPSTTARGDATGFISGMKGDGTLPFLGAGRATSNGVYADAIANLAKAIIRHDGTVKFTDAEITGVINALSGEIGQFAIVDGKLTADHSYMTYLPSGIYVEVTGDIQITSGGIIITNSYGGTTGHPQVVQWNIEITSTGVKVGDYEIRRDGFYESGNKIELGAGDYMHPPTHPADMITTGTFAGIIKAYNNTSYTTKQVRNMILSTGDAVSSQMANGDIWIKYE